MYRGAIVAASVLGFRQVFTGRSLPAGTGAPGGPLGGYTEPLSRVLLDWTPEDIQAAIITAESGLLRLAADLCTAMRGDDKIPSTLKSRILAVQGAPLTFEAAAAGRLRRRALKSLQAEEDFFDMLPEAELEQLRTWRLLLGVGLGELVWTEPDPADPTGEAVIARIRNGRNVPRLKVWDPRHLRKDMASGRWWVRTLTGVEVEVRPGDGQWILLTAGGNRPWLNGLWRGLADLWLAKVFARIDWARQSEKYANGIICFESPDGSDEDERKKFGLDLRDIGKEGVVVAPAGYKGKILELAGRAWETYDAQWTKSNLGFSVAVLGGDLASESKKSAGTGASLQGEVRDDLKKADAAQDETDIRAQVLCPWSRVSFGDPDLAPWPKWNVDPAEDRQALATTWNMTAQALKTSKEAGYALDWQIVREETGLPITGLLADVALPAPTPVQALAAAPNLATAAELLLAPLTTAELRALARMPANDARASFLGMFNGYREARASRPMRRAQGAPERLAA